MQRLSCDQVMVTAGQARVFPLDTLPWPSQALTPHSEEQATTSLLERELKGALKLRLRLYIDSLS